MHRTCTHCGRIVHTESNTPIVAPCRREGGGLCEFAAGKIEGAGDVLAKVLGAIGVTKARVAKLLGRPCGCAERQRKMNEKLPL